MKVFKTVMLITGIILLLLIIIVFGFFGYMTSKVTALPEVSRFTGMIGKKNIGENYLFNDKSGNYIVLPGKKNNNVGIILYPAALADEKAYIPVAFKFADEGYSVFIAKMPLRLSMLNTENGLNFIENFKDIKEWNIIGHSLGGLAASVFVTKHPGTISSCILWAAKPYADLKNSRIKVLLIFATKDGFFSKKSLEQAKEKLPAGATYYTIKGGNHSQFAWYPDMPGDLKADITREEQEKKVISATISTIKQKQQF